MDLVSTVLSWCNMGARADPPLHGHRGGSCGLLHSKARIRWPTGLLPQVQVAPDFEKFCQGHPCLPELDGGRKGENVKYDN